MVHGESLESGSVILKMKDGVCEPIGPEDGIILSVKGPVFGHKECQGFPGAFLEGWLARANRHFLSPKEIYIFRKKITLIKI